MQESSVRILAGIFCINGWLACFLGAKIRVDWRRSTFIQLKNRSLKSITQIFHRSFPPLRYGRQVAHNTNLTPSILLKTIFTIIKLIQCSLIPISPTIRYQHQTSLRYEILVQYLTAPMQRVVKVRSPVWELHIGGRYGWVPVDGMVIFQTWSPGISPESE